MERLTHEVRNEQVNIASQLDFSAVLAYFASLESLLQEARASNNPGVVRVALGVLAMQHTAAADLLRRL